MGFAQHLHSNSYTPHMFEHGSKTAFQTITRIAYNLCSFYLNDEDMTENIEDESLIDIDSDSFYSSGQYLFENLPYEIHQEISSHLDLSDICKLRLVSKQFSKI